MPSSLFLLCIFKISVLLSFSISGIVALSESEFYFTNLVTSVVHGWWMMVLELLAQMPWSAVVYCQYSLCHEVAGGLLGVCGMALSTQVDRQ
jgi:hypothetical protein